MRTQANAYLENLGKILGLWCTSNGMLPGKIGEDSWSRAM